MKEEMRKKLWKKAEYNWPENNEEHCNLANAYMMGANDLLKEVWHDASKDKPMDMELLLVNIPDREFGIDCYHVGTYLDSTGYFDSGSWKKEWDFVYDWAYVEDLIKEG